MNINETGDNEYRADDSKEMPEAINPTPDNPPWHWTSAVLVWIASVLFLVVPSFILFFYAVRRGVDVQNAKILKEFLLNDYTAVLIQVLLVIPAHLLTLILSWFVVTKNGKYPFFKTLGSKWNGFKFWHILAVIVGFYLAAYILVSIFGEQPNDFTKMLEVSRTIVYIVVVLAVLSAPVVEEVVYRGIIYSAFQKRFGVNFAIFVSTTLFAGVHVLQYYPSVAPIILIFLLSFILTMVRFKTSNLLPCIVLHMVFNAIQSISLILQPYLPESLGGLPEKAASVIHFLK